MDMSTMTSMVMSSHTTATSPLPTTTDFTPGYINSKGDYVPTAAERTAYQAARIPWADQVVYGYYTLALLAGLLVLFTLLRGLWHLRLRYASSPSHRPSPVYSKAVAVLRACSYPRLRPNRLLDLLWTVGPLGPNIVLLGGLLFASCLTWINKYYYYAPFYGSAPLYLRSEWIAMAELPFIIALSSKRNLISLLTGISHEKLQIHHQGLSFNFLYMSLVHTIAAIVRAYADYGFTLELKYNAVYVSGFVALAPLCVLFLGALPIFRRWSYEGFYWTHIVMALFFMGGMFWHGYQTLDSDAYMIASIVLFFFGLLWRLVMLALNNPFLHRCHASILASPTPDSGIIKLTIPTSTITWSPGQHVFLRFLHFRPFDNHPFTIALPPASSPTKDFKEMTFLLRPMSGFTRRLYERLQKNGGSDELSVLIDGPYGSSEMDALEAFDEVLILVGGSGVTWGMSLLLGLVQSPKGKARSIKFVWAVKHADELEWFSNELHGALAGCEDLRVELHVTRESIEHTVPSLLPAFPRKEELAVPAQKNIDAADAEAPPLAGTASRLSVPVDEEKGPSSGSSRNGKPQVDSHERLKVRQGRPDLHALIQEQVTHTKGSLAVAACGPAGFLADCANAVTAAQVRLLREEVSDVDEVYFVSEAFGW